MVDPNMSIMDALPRDLASVLRNQGILTLRDLMREASECANGLYGLRGIGKIRGGRIQRHLREHHGMRMWGVFPTEHETPAHEPRSFAVASFPPVDVHHAVSRRVARILMRVGIRTMRDLAGHTPWDLCGYRGIGVVALTEVTEYLASTGVRHASTATKPERAWGALLMWHLDGRLVSYDAAFAADRVAETT